MTQTPHRPDPAARPDRVGESPTGHDPRPTRRIVFHGLGALGVAAALAGCGGATTASDGDAATGGTPSAAAGATLIATADVPLKGGVILSDHKIVVTQPTEGEFKAFTAVCTHEGFLVTSVGDDTIMCNHHGSEYSASTGDVQGGPAPAPLAPVAITVTGGNIVAA